MRRKAGIAKVKLRNASGSPGEDVRYRCIQIAESEIRFLSRGIAARSLLLQAGSCQWPRDGLPWREGKRNKARDSIPGAKFGFPTMQLGRRGEWLTGGDYSGGENGKKGSRRSLHGSHSPRNYRYQDRWMVSLSE